jgi:hypothetical protein
MNIVWYGDAMSKPERFRKRVAKKHVTRFPVKERRNNLPRSERNQVTIGEFVYKRSKGHAGLSGKGYKLYKGEKVEDAIRMRGVKEVIVDWFPVKGKRRIK